MVKEELGEFLAPIVMCKEFHCIWSQGYPEIYNELKKDGFTPNQWHPLNEDKLKEAYDLLPLEYSLDDYKNNDIYVVFTDYLPEIHKTKNHLIASFRPICVLVKWTLFKPALQTPKPSNSCQNNRVFLPTP
jgi:hypothetical protein